jgi:putative toxin-antitoxin system antitoxin component (TIGR02293 family)
MASDLRAVVEALGGAPVFGRALRTPADLQAAIREGFPRTVIKEVMQAGGLTLRELAESLDLSPRSLQRRRKAGRLDRFESDRVYRLAHILALAKHALDDPAKAVRWLKRPNRALGGRAPLALIDTEIGARMVEGVLGRIAFGGIS